MAPYPPFGAVDAPPDVAVWQGLDRLPADCLISLPQSATLGVALAGQFTHTGSIDDMAARLGAISTTIGLPYWSVTDEAWKPLVSAATALGSADADDARRDFGTAEILSGAPLHFAQNDSRSWGDNVYRLQTLDTSPDRLVIATANVSRIKLGPVTLFPPEAILSVQFIQRLDGPNWGYYGLSVILDGAMAARSRSLINRQAALYRLLVGTPPDGEAPLAP